MDKTPPLKRLVCYRYGDINQDHETCSRDHFSAEISTNSYTLVINDNMNRLRPHSQFDREKGDKGHRPSEQTVLPKGNNDYQTIFITDQTVSYGSFDCIFASRPSATVGSGG